jgi:putative membrane protein
VEAGLEANARADGIAEVTVMRYWENGVDGAGGVVMVSGMLALWALAAVAIIWAVRSARSSTAIDARAQQPGACDAERILADRLARGETDPGEYRTTLALLRSRSAS